MNQRTRILIILLAVVGTALFGDYAYTHWFEQPATAHDRAITGVRKQIDDLKLNAAQARQASQLLPALEQQSLPYDVEMAQARYQEWLLEQVKKVNLDNAAVTAEPPIPVLAPSARNKRGVELYKRYGFALRGRGDLRQTAQLLFNFYQGGFLHKIVSLTLNPVGGGRQLDLSLRIEALGLARCDRRDALPTQAGIGSQQKEFAAYDAIVRRNPFSADSDSLWGGIILTGVSFDRAGKPECWLSDGQSTLGTQVLKRGDSIAVGPHQLEVVEIQGDRALVSIDGQMIMVELGKSVKEGRILHPGVDL